MCNESAPVSRRQRPYQRTHRCMPSVLRRRRPATVPSHDGRRRLGDNALRTYSRAVTRGRRVFGYMAQVRGLKALWHPAVHSLRCFAYAFFRFVSLPLSFLPGFPHHRRTSLACPSVLLVGFRGGCAAFGRMRLCSVIDPREPPSRACSHRRRVDWLYRPLPFLLCSQRPRHDARSGTRAG